MPHRQAAHVGPHSGNSEGLDRAAPSGVAEVLVLVDDAESGRRIAAELQSAGCHVTTSSPHAAAEMAERAPFDVVVIDAAGDAAELAASLRARTEATILASASTQTALEAARRASIPTIGADRGMVALVQLAAEKTRLRRVAASLRRDAASHAAAALLGPSRAATALREATQQASTHDGVVFVVGESGTGRVATAVAVHDRSARSAHASVVFACDTLSGDVLERELFGYAAGAVPGALRERPGALESTAGTVVLREAGAMPAALQARLARALESGSFERMGETTKRAVSVRVMLTASPTSVAHVGADLQARVATRIELAPLRDRREDIPALALALLGRTAARYGLRAFRLAPEAVTALLSHPFSGNVRELAASIEAAALRARTDTVRLDELTLPQAAALPVESRGAERPAFVQSALGALAPLYDDAVPLPPLKEVRDALERAYLMESLRRAAGNVTLAAKLAGRNRTDFHDLLRRHNVTRSSFREPAH